MVKKYSKLSDYLRKSDKKKIELTFSDIEAILSFTLPYSAHNYRPWWANDKKHSQAIDGWMPAGYRTESVSISKQIVTLSQVAEPLKQEPDELDAELDSSSFEKFAQKKMSEHFKSTLSQGKKESWPKLFDMVSPDFTIAGDAKYLSVMGGTYIPTAKLSSISELVWMLEKTDAQIKFLTFGNDVRVPEEWLKKYEKFAGSVSFYFLPKEGEITTLWNAHASERSAIE